MIVGSFVAGCRDSQLTDAVAAADCYQAGSFVVADSLVAADSLVVADSSVVALAVDLLGCSSSAEVGHSFDSSFGQEQHYLGNKLLLFNSHNVKVIYRNHIKFF